MLHYMLIDIAILEACFVGANKTIDLEKAVCFLTVN